jgi:Tfp pilus assembly protein PilF
VTTDQRDPFSFDEVSGGTAAPAEPLWLRGTALPLLLLTVIAVLPYVNTLQNSFVYDDFDQVVNNPYLRNFHHLREIFTSSVWSFKGDFRGSTNYYRPMMSLGYLACYQLMGPKAWAYHLINILLNAGVVLLVYLIASKLLHSRGVGFASACIFALHPIHSEAVNWIAAVTELELAFFFLLTFWLFVESARAGGGVSLPIQAGMAASFALALLSKEQALILPFLALVYEHFFREDRRKSTPVQKARRYAVLWILSLAYLLVRIHFLGRFAPSQERIGFGKWDLVISALALFGKYSFKMIWPTALCAYYVFPLRASALRGPAMEGAIAFLICFLVVVRLWKSNRQAAFGMVWFLVALLPVLNVRFLASNAFAERYLYLASVGFCWISGWGLVRTWAWLAGNGSTRKWIFAIAVGMLAIVAARQIVMRNRDWRDDITFYTSALKASPNAYYMHNNLGTSYWQRGDVAGAKKEWAIAYQLAPASEYVLHNMGLAASTERDYPRAKVFYLDAIKVQPNYMDAHLDLGTTYAAMGEADQAESEFLAAEKLSPLSLRVHNTLSGFYLNRHQPEKAQEEARLSLAIQPTAEADWDLGLADWLKADPSGAEKAFRDGLALEPSSGRGHFMLGRFYMDAGRNVEAISEFRTALRIDPTNAVASADLNELEFLENGK